MQAWKTIQEYVPPDGFWQVHAVFLRKLRDFSENPNWWCFPNAKAASTQKGFPRPNAFSSNGETPLLAPAYFPRTLKRRFSPRRVFHEWQNAVARPNVFSPNGKMPLPAQTCFPLTAKCRCSSRRIFFKRQNAAAQKSVFFSFRFEFFSLSY